MHFSKLFGALALTGALSLCFAAQADEGEVLSPEVQQTEDADQKSQLQCKPYNLLVYNLRNNGLTFQNSGDVTSDPSVLRIEMFANSDTGQWALLQIRTPDYISGEAAGIDNTEEAACRYKAGEIFFHERKADTEGRKTSRQSVMALHGNGDSGNELFEIEAHKGSGRWSLRRRISATKSTIVFAGNNYREENNPPNQPLHRISYTLD